MKFITLLILILPLLASGSDHPNLNSDTIVFDEEAFKCIKRSDLVYRNYMEFRNSDPNRVEYFNYISIKTDSIKKMLLDSLNANEVIYYDRILFYVYSPNGIIYELVINNGLSGLEFKTNKKLRNVLDLKLAQIRFGDAEIECRTKNIWYAKNNAMVYVDTQYSQFKFYDIKPVEYKNMDEVIHRILGH